MAYLIFFDKLTGEIQGYGTGPITASGASGITVSELIPNQNLQYVDLSIAGLPVTQRPTFPISVDKMSIAADGKDTATISGIPANTVCNYEGTNHTITDGMIEFTADHGGDYILQFTLFPYIPYSLTIRAS